MNTTVRSEISFILINYQHHSLSFWFLPGLPYTVVMHFLTHLSFNQTNWVWSSKCNSLVRSRNVSCTFLTSNSTDYWECLWYKSAGWGDTGRHCRISVYHRLFPPGFSGVPVMLTPNRKDLPTLSCLWEWNWEEEKAEGLKVCHL